MSQKQPESKSEVPAAAGEELSFKYYKSNFFRVIHADGAWGGVSPRGNIHMSFYNERGALPDSSKVRLSNDGTPLGPEKFHSGSRIVREFECDIVVDLATAKSLRAWLDQKVTELENLVSEAVAAKYGKPLGESNDEEMALEG